MSLKKSKKRMISKIKKLQNRFGNLRGSLKVKLNLKSNYPIQLNRSKLLNKAMTKLKALLCLK